jgi:hypothetical protein
MDKFLTLMDVYGKILFSKTHQERLRDRPFETSATYRGANSGKAERFGR